MALRRDHPRVARWLENFLLEERETAALLIDGLKLVSETDLRRELGDLVAGLVARLPGPVAAFPAREVASEDSAHEEGRLGGYQLLPPGMPGSESVIANILTGITRRPHITADEMLPDLSLPSLRDKKVRTILLVDDFSGSGSRILKFHSALLRHPTIASWNSLHLIDVHVAAYFATDVAMDALGERFSKEKIHVVRACPTFERQGWTEEQLVEVEELCRKHVPKVRRGRPDYALGYGDSRALIAFEHTAPNNLPKILWQVRPDWHSLFEFKSVPSDLLTLFTMFPAPPQEPLAGSSGAQRLGDVLELLARRIRDAHAIAAHGDISLSEVHRLLNLLQSLGYAASGLRLTEAGRAELKRQRDANPPLVLPNRDDPYYPQQLRAER